MRAFAFRYLVAAALLLQVVLAWSQETIKIAYIGGLSSAFALQFEEALKPFRAAADIVNSRGGVLGGRRDAVHEEEPSR
jgi:hypothetical protein